LKIDKYNYIYHYTARVLMSIANLQKRFSDLYKLRDKLCTKEKNWNDAFSAKDWIVNQLNELKSIVLDDTKSNDDILARLADIICVLEPEECDSE